MTARRKWVAPAIEGTVYRWRFGEVTFEVDAALGARITAFRIGSENILTGPETNGLNFGSTFWTSPQSQWGWPPPVAIDSEPYQPAGEAGGTGADAVDAADAGDAAGAVDRAAIVSLVGRPDRTLGLAVTKNFAVDAERETVAIEYVIRNGSAEARTVAPWEISRHPIGGLTFFPSGAGIDPASTLAVREANGAVWFDYDAESITDHQKMFGHGAEGWVAHLDLPRRMLLLKTFAEIAPEDQAPGQAQIELYADPDHTYVEVEEQGAYRPIAPGGELRWTVTWRLRRLPPALATLAGSKDLLALARALTTAP